MRGCPIRSHPGAGSRSYRFLAFLWLFENQLYGPAISCASPVVFEDAAKSGAHRNHAITAACFRRAELSAGIRFSDFDRSAL